MSVVLKKKSIRFEAEMKGNKALIENPLILYEWEKELIKIYTANNKVVCGRDAHSEIENERNAGNMRLARTVYACASGKRIKVFKVKQSQINETLGTRIKIVKRKTNSNWFTRCGWRVTKSVNCVRVLYTSLLVKRITHRLALHKFSRHRHVTTNDEEESKLLDKHFHTYHNYLDSIANI